MKTIIGDRTETLCRAADTVGEMLARKPEAILALSADDDCLALYRELARRILSGRFDMSRARFFAASEFENPEHGLETSCRSRLKKALLDTADPEGERSFFLCAENVDVYDASIADCGGLDLAVLSVGERGRIAFNEPATPFDSQSHRQKLTKATRRSLAPLFGSEEQTPEYGYTMGIHTLLSAGKLLVIATGEERADPVFRMLYARTDSFVPAAFLQLPPQVFVFLDEAAASKL